MGRITLFTFLLFSVGILCAQTPYDPTPKKPTIASFDIIPVGNQVVIPKTSMPSIGSLGADNRAQLNQYERDRRQTEFNKKQTDAIYKELRDGGHLIRYNLPSHQSDSRTEHYYKAFELLSNMDANDFSIKEATFIVENAFYEDSKSYIEFEETVSNTTNFITAAMKQQGYDPKNNVAKNLAIYQFITDTLKVNGTTHNPYTYDFNDYMGRDNWDNMFVHKLIQEGSGQCNSLPRWYMILAEELKAETYLALAPNHSFIRFRDALGDWHNAELTSGAIMSDIFMLDSGFIKSETIVNGNYMTSLSQPQVMSLLLNDLASGYISKFGMDQFVMEVINSSLELNPSGMNGNLHKINFQIAQLSYVMKQLGVSHPMELNPYPRAVELRNALIEQDRKLRQLGYEQMPQERYEAWLESLEQEKKKQKTNGSLDGLKKQILLKD